MLQSFRLFGSAVRGAQDQTPLDRTISAVRPAIWGLIAFSSVTTILSIVPALYMLNVFDRVLSSRNITTLIMLTVITLFLMLISGVLDKLRASLSLRLGIWCDERVAPPLLAAVQDMALRSGRHSEANTMRDLDQFREFWAGQGIHTIVRATWSPLFVILLFILHPFFGYVALGGVTIIALLTFANEKATSGTLRKATNANQQAAAKMSAAIRNIEAMHAMGMRAVFRGLWYKEHRAALQWQSRSSDKAAIFTVSSTFVQSALGNLTLALGAYLAIQGEISAGAIFASRILFGLAVGPLTEIVRQWKSFVTASISYSNLQAVFREVEDDSQRILLPPPEGALSLQGVVLEQLGTRRIVLRNVSFSTEPGDIVAIIGASGSGKSTLVRAIVGAVKPVMGEIRIAGAELKHWQVDQLGAYLGYVPQEVELIPGTIAENIARFGKRDDETIIEAAKLVDAHDLIQSLPDGYNTRIDIDGRGLSGGQRQRIALARAAYGEPSLIVLDEPNANLDSAGEQALIRAIREFKRMGITVIIVTHKAQILSVVDKVAMVSGGTVSHFGHRDEVMPRLASRNVVAIPGAAS